MQIRRGDIFYADLSPVIGCEQGGVLSLIHIQMCIRDRGLDGHEVTEQHWKNTVAFLDYLEKEKIGWINWSLCNKEEGYSMLKPDSIKLHGWDIEDMSDSGKFVLKYLSLDKN